MEKLKVILVDDEEEFITTLAERLRIRGIDTLTATDGEEALRLLRSDPVQVAVVDVMMPGIGGLDVLKHINRNHPAVRVILLTGRGSTKEGMEGMRLGAFDYLMKPVDIEELIEKMSSATSKD